MREIMAKHGPARQHGLLDDILRDIAETPTGENKANLVRSGKVPVMVGKSPELGISGYYDPNKRVAVVSTNVLARPNGKAEAYDVVAHELTHALQHDRNKVFGSDLRPVDN